MEIRKILLVDDEPALRKIGALTLERLGGWKVVTADSGERALDLVPSEAPDLILLDVMLPGLDGPSTYRRLADGGFLENRIVIFMTAGAFASDAAALLALGAAGVITKPFDPMTLPDAIRAIVARAPAPQSGPERESR